MTVSTLLICGWLLLIYVDPVMGPITPVRSLLGLRDPDDPQGPPST